MCACVCGPRVRMTLVCGRVYCEHEAIWTWPCVHVYVLWKCTNMQEQLITSCARACVRVRILWSWKSIQACLNNYLQVVRRLVCVLYIVNFTKVYEHARTIIYKYWMHENVWLWTVCMCILCETIEISIVCKHAWTIPYRYWMHIWLDAHAHGCVCARVRAWLCMLGSPTICVQTSAPMWLMRLGNLFWDGKRLKTHVLSY